MLILVVDDEALIRQGIGAKIEAMNFPAADLLFAENGEQALALIENRDVSIVLTDIKMMELDGLELIKRAKQKKAHVQFILISGYAEFSYAREAMLYGVQDYLLKPILAAELKAALERAIAKLDERKEIDLGKKLQHEYLHSENEQAMFRLVNEWIKQEKPTEELCANLLEKLRGSVADTAVKKSEPYLCLGLIRFDRGEAPPQLREFLRNSHPWGGGSKVFYMLLITSRRINGGFCWPEAQERNCGKAKNSFIKLWRKNLKVRQFHALSSDTVESTA